MNFHQCLFATHTSANTQCNIKIQSNYSSQCRITISNQFVHNYRHLTITHIGRSTLTFPLNGHNAYFITYCWHGPLIPPQPPLSGLPTRPLPPPWQRIPPLPSPSHLPTRPPLHGGRVPAQSGPPVPYGAPANMHFGRCQTDRQADGLDGRLGSSTKQIQGPEALEGKRQRGRVTDTIKRPIGLRHEWEDGSRPRMRRVASCVIVIMIRHSVT